MLTHETIWLAIDRLAQSNSLSTSGLAKKAGLDPTSFNRSKRVGADGKPRWPSTESISRILNATESTLSEFITLIGAGEGGSVASRIPLLALQHAGRSEFFDAKGHPTRERWEDSIELTHFSDGTRHFYALEVSGDVLLPLFREGDRLVVSPDAPVRRGDRVVVKTTDGDVLVREINRQTAGKVELSPLGQTDGEMLTLSPKDIQWIARVVWVSQ